MTLIELKELVDNIITENNQDIPLKLDYLTDINNIDIYEQNYLGHIYYELIINTY